MTSQLADPKPGPFSLEAPYTPADAELLLGGEKPFIPAEHGVIPVAEQRANNCFGCCYDGEQCLLYHPKDAPESPYVPDCSPQHVIFIRDTPEARAQYVVWHFNAVVIGVEDE